MKSLFFILLILSATYADVKYKGLIAATFTPMNDDGTLNLALVKPHAEYLQKTGVSGVFVGGTTGESLILTLEERKKLAEAWVVEGKKCNLKVIIHVGCDSPKEARELAAHAESIKADAIGAMSTVFFKPASISVLIDEMNYIALGAPNTDFLYYHLPSMTGCALSMPDFLEAAYEKIKTFAGIKFTDVLLNDVTEMQWIIKAHVKKGEKAVSILYGRDEQYDSALFMDVDGGVGSTYNYAATIYNYIIGNHTAGNHELVRENQYRSQKFIRIFSKYGSGNYYPNKWLCSNTTGINFGKPRLPYVEITQEMKDNMYRELKAVGYYDWLK